MGNEYIGKSMPEWLVHIDTRHLWIYPLKGNALEVFKLKPFLAMGSNFIGGGMTGGGEGVLRPSWVRIPCPATFLLTLST